MMKAAVVGLGWWGRHFVNTIETSDKLTVTRIAARNREKHQEFADEKGLKLLGSYEEVLADPEQNIIGAFPSTRSAPFRQVDLP